MDQKEIIRGRPDQAGSTEINPDKILAAGLMSGTSLDGIDAALVLTDGYDVEPYGKPVHVPYDQDFQNLIREGIGRAALYGEPVKDDMTINKLEVVLTDHHQTALQKLMVENKLSWKKLDVIGFHGQTLLHKPEAGWTWQIGKGEQLANRLQIPVVNDFRSRDMSLGGQGAPLAPIYHLALACRRKQRDKSLALLNIGGVTNLTWIPPDRRPEELLAFDTGPGNALLNDWIHKHTGNSFDQDGAISVTGKVDQALLESWMAHDYFTAPPPKSLDRNMFEVPGLDGLSVEDGAATLCAFTVETVKAAEGLCPSIPENWYVCGGGRHNPVIMDMLRKRLLGTVHLIEELGAQGDFIEAEAFAYMAVRKLKDLPISFPGTTGVAEPSPGGVIHYPAC
ncbi:anhydro-N-acetylmuramic acid kinase [Luteithermobacter gelatinilyticus]|uniref:anhydro-N-acetylmuramic acid kinase n=1 Tax=Luteithermobacter gelatinilyticus TaxID=2582913 RepID=UPI001106C145|nr:anhydro-N-acetylmuramic acid kinase [Luteithermobacter gelatinilyticus]